MDSALHDLRHAVRSLLARPGFTVVALVTLSLGLGSTTAIFSVVDDVVLRPLPYHEPSRLVTLWGTSPEKGSERAPVSFPDFTDWREASSFSAMAAYDEGRYAVTGLGEAEMMSGARVTPAFFRVFRELPSPGRSFAPEEAVEDGPAVVIVSHALWQGALGGDPAVLGRMLEIDGRPHQVVGVAPRGFSFPRGARLWLPLQHDAGCGRGCRYLEVVARLADGTTLDRAATEMRGLAARLQEAYPEDNTGVGIALVPLHELVVGDVKLGLSIVFGAVVLVLLIACANVANLMLARGASRKGEVAVRAALGAGRGRLVFQLLAESLVLSTGGGVVGILLALWGLDGLKAVSPVDVPRMAGVTVDGSVLLFAGGLVLVTTLLFGLGPALHLSRSPAWRVLDRAPEGDVGFVRPGWGRTGLLVAEVALSLMLLTGAGLLLKSVQKLHDVELGFDPRSVVAVSVNLPPERYPEARDRLRFFSDLRERLASDGRVEAVGSVLGSPLGSDVIESSYRVTDRAAPPPGEEPTALLRVATPGYFRALRIPLLEGRLFDERDRIDTERVAVVSETLARRAWPREDPVGEEVTVGIDLGSADTIATVVGVVGDVRSRTLTEEPVPEIYVSHLQEPVPYLTVHVRALPNSGGTPVLSDLVRDQVRALDRDLPLMELETLGARVERSTATSRFYLVLLVLFATVAVSLAAVGLYGVVTYLVSRRTREIGIRMALGAEEGHVLGLVLRQGLGPALAGVVLGVLGSLVVSRVLRSLLYRVAPDDPATLVGVTGVLVTVVLGATVLPARRATRIAPSEAIRTE